MQIDTTPFDWVVSHIRIVGWPTVMGASIWGTVKLVRFLDKVLSRLESAEKNLDLLANNHFSHIEESLISIADTFQKIEPSLATMNTSIQILLDRDDYRTFSNNKLQ